MCIYCLSTKVIRIVLSLRSYLEYMVKIWRLHLKQQKTSIPRTTMAVRLPVILPIVLYHGNQAWPHGTHFADLLSESKKTLAAYIPDFAMILTDLTRYSDEDIKGTVLSQVILLLFKYISHPEFRPKLPEIFALMHKLSQQEHGLQYLELILRYIVVRPKMFRQKNVSA